MGKSRFFTGTWIFFVALCGTCTLCPDSRGKIDFPKKESSLGYSYSQAILKIISGNADQDSPLEALLKQKRAKYLVSRIPSQNNPENAQNEVEFQIIDQASHLQGTKAYIVRRKPVYLIKKEIYLYEVTNRLKKKGFCRELDSHFFITKKDLLSESLSRPCSFTVSMVLLANGSESLVWAEMMLKKLQEVYRERQASLNRLPKSEREEKLQDLKKKIFEQFLEDFIHVANISWLVSDVEFHASISLIKERFSMEKGIFWIAADDDKRIVGCAFFMLALLSFQAQPSTMYFHALYESLEDTQRAKMVLKKYRGISAASIRDAKRRKAKWPLEILPYTTKKESNTLFPKNMTRLDPRNNLSHPAYPPT